MLGASGQLGKELVAELDRRPEPLEVLAASRSAANPDHRFDLEQPESVRRLFRTARPEIIVLAAAATNVTWCEENPERSSSINVTGTRVVAEAARDEGALLTFLSTDYVFDGRGGPYGEDASTNPINTYGQHKLAAEGLVLGVSAANLVIRTCQVFGSDPRRVNFVLRVADQLRRNETVQVASDLFGTPTYAPDLARALVHLALARESGIWHVAGDSFLSRYDLAWRVARAFGVERASIEEVSAADMHDSVNRPRQSGLLCARLAANGLSAMTPIGDALAAMVAAEGNE